ncbi:vesicle-trafficking protein SEC22c isoform X2 [Engystomops pustulosus]|uniref:vesicle-trafficking protein SEC22c isoform X2 n=1 Tax=Engystomops pustulosus TaxID=76066 RepID=UPI003AFA5E0E
MILYARVVRLQDGLPLSASTDFHQNQRVLECRRWLRRLCVDLHQRPARGSALVGDLSIHFCSAGDISSLTICSSSYQAAAAFSFLEELIWEFSSSYNSSSIALASRPYAFLEFDSVIQRVKHNFNYGTSPPIRLDPSTAPVSVKLEELGEANGTANGHLTRHLTPANHRMSPVSGLGILSMTLNIMCCALSLIRGMHLAENSFQDGYENAGKVLAFLMAFSASIFQCYLYLFSCRARTLKAWVLLLVLALCNLHLYGLRNLWQIGFHVFVGFLSALQIMARRPLDRHRDCGV